MRTSKQIYIILTIIFASSNLHAQRNKEIGNFLRVGALFSHSSDFAQYDFSYSFDAVDNDYLLEFLTETSGTFEIERDTVAVSNDYSFSSPKRQLNFGMSFQIIKPTGLFQEFGIINLSVTELSLSSQTTIIHLDFEDPVIRMQNENFQLFELGLRYEIGSFLRDMKSKKMNFGISLFLKPDLTVFNSISQDFGSFPFKSTIFSTNLGVGMTLLFQVSNRTFIELRSYPSIELFDISNVRYENPIFPRAKGEFRKRDNQRNVKHEAMLSVKYAIKVPHKKGRRMRF